LLVRNWEGETDITGDYAPVTVPAIINVFAKAERGFLSEHVRSLI